MAHLAILTPSSPGTTFAATGLNFRVRDGIGCFPSAIDTPKMYIKSHSIKKNLIYILSYIINTLAKNFIQSFSLTKQVKKKERIRMTREKSRRKFSIGQLNPLLNLHLRPINLVVFKVP
jgi:hypothetical protein